MIRDTYTSQLDDNYLPSRRNTLQQFWEPKNTIRTSHALMSCSAKKRGVQRTSGHKEYQVAREHAESTPQGQQGLQGYAITDEAIQAFYPLDAEVREGSHPTTVRSKSRSLHNAIKGSPTWHGGRYFGTPTPA